MAENAELLDEVLPLFYDADRDDFDFGSGGFESLEFGDEESSQRRCAVAKFFDKFPLNSAKVALYVHLQSVTLHVVLRLAHLLLE